MRHGPSASLGHLLAELGVPGGVPSVDGVVRDVTTPLADIPTGALVEPVSGNAPAVTERPLREMRVVAGPDAGLVVPLPDTGLVLGGPSGHGVVVRDTRLAPFAAVLEVVDGGVVCVPVADPLARTCSLPPGVPVQLGGTVICVGPVTVRPAVDRVVEDHRCVHHRPARRRAAAWSDAPVAVESPTRGVAVVPPASPPMPALIGAAVTAPLALVLRQPMLAAFGVSGAAVALIAWAHTRRGQRRAAQEEAAAAARSGRLKVRQEMDRRRSLEEYRRATVPDLCEALARVEALDARLWERRAGHDDAWRVTLGIGEHGWSPLCDGAVAEVLRGVPVEVDIGPSAVLGLIGDRDRTRAVARSLVLQLAANVGPADLGVTVVTDRPTLWEWTAWLPHDVEIAGSVSSVPDTDRHRVVVVDLAGAPIAQPLGGAIVLADSMETSSAACTALVTLSGASARLQSDLSGALPTPVVPAGLALDRAMSTAARLACLHDPLGSSRSAGPLPLDGVLSPSDIERRWASATRPTAPVGVASNGVVTLDLVRDGPHALVGGTTGAGKSELLRTLVVGLAASSPPERLSFLLVDYKGGAAFDACTRLPHVVGVVDDLDPATAARALRSLHAELQRREHVLRAAGAADIDALDDLADPPHLARLVVVVDEFATLAADLPEFVPSLVGIAQRGRSLGVHLVLATQRPGGAITDDIRANTNLRIALRVTSTAESSDIVGDPVAAAFPRHRPGLAAIRRAADDLTVVQVASTAHRARLGLAGDQVDVRLVESPAIAVDELSTDGVLDAWVDGIALAAVGRPAVHRPWTDPLPDQVETVDLIDPADVGLLDDPDAQTLRSLRWADDALLVVGSPRSGRSSALMAAVARRNERVVVIDAGGDPRWSAMRDAGAVESVVRVDESERLARLVGVVDRPGTVLVVDGLTQTRAALGELDTDLLDRFDAVVADPAGPAVAIATTDVGGLSAGSMSRLTTRWVLRLTDAYEATVLGARAGDVPVDTAPPGRVFVLPDRLAGQVLQPPDLVRDPSLETSGPDPIAVLPRRVDRRDLGPSVRRGHAADIPLGVAWRTLEPLRVRWSPDDHLLVCGPSGSGRSSALASLAAAWREALGGPVVVVHGRSGGVEVDGAHRAQTAADAARVVGEAIGSGATPLIVVDDAERVDDPTGALSTVLSSGGIFVVAAGKGEQIRASFGHWTAAVRRGRTGLLLGLGGPTDGDVLGVALPRRRVVPDAPGRGWWVDDGHLVDLVQIAIVPDEERTSSDVARHR